MRLFGWETVDSAARRLRAAALAALAAVGLALAAAPADAATVTVRPDPDTIWEEDSEPAYDEVHYVAAPGERNRLLVSYAADARSVVVSDPGAVVTALGSCASVDPHTASCTSRPRARVEWLQSTRAELGDSDDEIRTTRPGLAPIGGVVAFGGPGDDLLDGGAGSDRLDGGGGRDWLLGGGGLDVLSDGDLDGAPGDAAPGADVLDGGDDFDVLSYAQRIGGVTVTLGDGSSAGAPAEGDRIAGFESVTGGAGDDRLTGDGGVNILAGGDGADRLAGLGGTDDNDLGDRLEGGAGPDRLSGGDGPDDLVGGSGVDRVFCGREADMVRDARPGELLPRDCETLSFSFGPDDEDTLSFPARPRAAGRGAIAFTLSCPTFEEYDGELASCRGRLTLRESGARGRLLARGFFADRGERPSFRVRLTLTALGRRAARHPDGVRATASLRGRRLPTVGWDLMVKTR